MEESGINGDQVEEEEAIEYSDSSEAESEDETRPKEKKVKKTIFSDDFTFESSDNDPWSKFFVKKKNAHHKYNADTDVRFNKAHVEEAVKHKRSAIKDEDAIIDIGSESDSDGPLHEGKAADRLNIRDKDLKKKERQNKVKKKKKKNTEEEEDKNSQYFEESASIKTDTTFQEMNLSRPLLKAIDNMAYNVPTPIQAATIPVALLGRDICGCAATGTGKTAAFMLPILERLLFKPKEDLVTRVLVLVPTRELGVQVFEVSKNLAKYSPIDLALSVGGLDLRSQEVNLRKNPDIVIATPGRLIDHLKNTPSFSLDRIEILVLDEADRMLDEYFAEQMKEIIKQCSRSRQTLLFSATMSTEVTDLAAVSLENPVKIFVNSNKSVAQNLRQEFVKIRKTEEMDREAVLVYLVSRTFHENCIVFIQTKALCHRMSILLKLLDINVGELHGNLSQMQRLEALDNFKKGEIGVLLCTDLAARGLDIPHVKTVINFTLPGTYQSYVHRVGRTARAGHCGRSISLVGEQEYRVLKQIKKSSNTVVYERQPNRAILQKFRTRIEKLDTKIHAKLRTEKEEREIRSMENSLNGMKKKLDVEPENYTKREWFQSHQERLVEKKRLMIAEKSKKQKKGKGQPKKPQISEQERRLQRELDFAQRVAKRASKKHRVKTSVGDDVEVKSRKPELKGKTRLFDKELTSTDRRSVKKFRHGPSYQERKDAFGQKNPGKKFNPKRKRK